jgi:hypothetical protein
VTSEGIQWLRSGLPTVCEGRQRFWGGMHCFWRVVSGELVCGQVVCGELVCGQVVRGQLVCGQLVCGELVCGQVVRGQLVCGQLVCGRAAMAINGQCMMAMHTHRCNREPVVAMIPLSSLSLRDWKRSSVPYPTVGGARTMSPTTGHTATASCEEGVTGGEASALCVSRRDATTRRSTCTCSSQRQCMACIEVH